MPTESLPILTDEKNTIKIWEEGVQNTAQSVSQAVFDRVIFLRIFGGPREDQIYEAKRIYANGKERKNELVYKRFGKYLDEWEKNQGHVAVKGTPIEQWPLIDVQRSSLCKHMGVFSVEQLAELSDGALQALGIGSRELRTKAQDWLKTAADAKGRMEAETEKRQLQAQIGNLQAQFNELAEALNALPPEQKAQVQEKIRERGKTKAA